MRSFALTWILCTNHAFAWISISFQHVAKINRRTSLKVSLTGDINNGESEVRSPLGASIEELSNILGGRGRALACWECLRIGVDPSWYFSKEASDKEPQTFDMNTNGGIEKNELNIQGILGKQAYFSLANMANVERDVAKLTQICTSVDGTKKFLLQLRDGLEIESVIIPWDDRGSSTLCISSQVGCRQGCTFCATGRMGKLRSLSRDEILSQVYWANKICRLENTLYRMENIVFMGMGEPGDNVEEVIAATNTLVDHNMFGFASKRVTISTVGPHPDVFVKLAEAPAVIAWSVHATRQEVRNALVPTTKFSMEQLREFYNVRSHFTSRNKRFSRRRFVTNHVLQANSGESSKASCKFDTLE
jgi:Radical SAM superfamily